MDKIVEKNVCLNSFLCDEEIIESIKSLYGTNDSVDDLGVEGKYTFFEKDDATTFVLSKWSIGTD